MLVKLTAKLEIVQRIVQIDHAAFTGSCEYCALRVEPDAGDAACRILLVLRVVKYKNKNNNRDPNAYLCFMNNSKLVLDVADNQHSASLVLGCLTKTHCDQMPVWRVYNRPVIVGKPRFMF